MKTIFVDMDGVLTFFEKKYTEINGMTPHEMRQSRDKKAFSTHWAKFVEERGFAQLDWFPGGPELVEFLNKQPAQKCILSSSGGMLFHNEVQSQKREWLKSHGIDWPVTIVPGRRFKAGFASTQSALIDDTPDVIESFTKSGGLGILHVKDAKWRSTYEIEQWLRV